MFWGFLGAVCIDSAIATFQSQYIQCSLHYLSWNGAIQLIFADTPLTVLHFVQI